MAEPVNRDFLDLLSAFNDREVRYLVVGGVAYSTYVEPRHTKDLDVWIDATPENAKRVWNALGEFGAPLEDLKLADLSTPGVVYQIGLPPRRIDVLTRVTGLAFDEAWPNRTRVEYVGVPVHVSGAADLARNKRSVGRPQDLLDAEQLERRARP
jgi:hypothetical protein